jgi:hypothetical protein
VREQSMRPLYVEFVPKTLEDGVLYISRRFRTASHRCCCGCGTKIVTPLRETEYQLTERGDRVSLSPSIGNWNHPCQSHYLIQDNQVVWAGPMSQAEIRIGRVRDDELKEAHFSKVAWPLWRQAWSWVKRFLSEIFS